MSRRSSSNRRRARRTRQQSEPERVPAPPRELTAQEEAQILAKYRSMEGRGGVKIGFEPMGRVVQARNPEELKEAAEQALVDETLKQDPS